MADSAFLDQQSVNQMYTKIIEIKANGLLLDENGFAFY